MSTEAKIEGAGCCRCCGYTWFTPNSQYHSCTLYLVRKARSTADAIRQLQQRITNGFLPELPIQKKKQSTQLCYFRTGKLLLVPDERCNEDRRR